METVIEMTILLVVAFCAGGTFAVAMSHPRIKIMLDAVREIENIAETNQIADRWGERHGQACDATCLFECGRIAKKALTLHASSKLNPGPLFPADGQEGNLK